ncbi:N-6 DNA methylase [uncultured Draconibacterium sp.]|uniref:HsdM family class I SAM-dependent methyltransferase n=1 Tax=uncultured Draconibacterium sp. TaxID=1573823 RepID=UPI003217A953
MPICTKLEISEYLNITEFKDFIFEVHKNGDNPRIEYFKLQAKLVGADYIYCIKNELEEKLIPFIYIYDERGCDSNPNTLSEINKKVWTVGEVPLAISIFSDEIKIIDTRKPISEREEANIYKAVKVISDELKSQIFRGRILEESSNDYLKLSPYEKLLAHIEANILNRQKEIGCGIDLLKRLVVKFILIKYLEEQTDENDENVFTKNYFNQFSCTINLVERNFCDILRNGDIVSLLNSLDKKFNGGIFRIVDQEEIQEIRNSNFNPIADALDGDKELEGQIRIWRLYDFNLLPIEFISRLYERFVTSGNKQKSFGAYYTPPHLARLLVDEVLPFDKSIDFNNFRILDPTCGSGIFLTLAYKRLITIWMLSNNKTSIKGKKDIEAIQNILSNCIYGIDISADALAITATSLQIELTSHIRPKEIWENLQFQDLEEHGNLKEVGFFKWYSSQTNNYDIILGNPPFNLDEKIVRENELLGKDVDYSKFKYLDFNKKYKEFPYKNPALTILYFCLSNLLSENGEIFLVLPSSSFLYMPTSDKFRTTIFKYWNVAKIYDFTLLMNHLWGTKSPTATIAIKVNKQFSNSNAINHYVIRNTFLNEKGSVFFQIDKYDRFRVNKSEAIQSNFPWKLHLFGGGKLKLFFDKYKSNFISIKDYINTNGFYSTGLRNAKEAKRTIDIKGEKKLVSNNFKQDILDNRCIENVKSSEIYRHDVRDIFEPPNVLIRLNLNYSLPSIYNKEKIFFRPGVIGIKVNKLEQFEKHFKLNREFYITLIHLSSSKTFIQQAGSYSIDANDVLQLPINVDEMNNLIPFPKVSAMEKIVFEDTKLFIEDFKNASGLFYTKVNKTRLDNYEKALCEILNEMFTVEKFKFRTTRKIIEDDYTWITFEHNEAETNLETCFSSTNENLFKEILSDALTNSALSINQVITYYGEKNKISFIKPSTYKYWMQSIAYRDAENVKADLFNQGY